jgi:hypothetical protein
VGGTISGLVTGSAGVALTLNGAAPVVFTSNGNFRFLTDIPNGTAYSVAVAANPAAPPVDQTCVVADGDGTSTSDVVDLTVTCTTLTFAVGGTVQFANGLDPGTQLTLAFTDDPAVPMTQTLVITETAAGTTSFGFPSGGTLTTVPSGSQYAIGISMQPDHQTCTFGNGSLLITGTVSATSPTAMTITCTELNGGACAGGGECTSGACLTKQGGGGSVCCATTCSGTDATTCAVDGQCAADGSGCADWASGTTCSGATCSGHTLTAASTCNGSGVCNTGTAAACPGSLKCAASGTACLAQCTQDTDCVAGHFCNGGTCASTSGAGMPCAADNQCGTGHCVTVQGGGSKVCCATTCTAAGASTCADDGQCAADGSGCADYASGTVCVAASCTGNTLTQASACNGGGVCNAGTQQTCPGSLKCAPGGTACLAQCGQDSDCVSGYYCKTGTCTATQGDGTGCSSNDQCSTGHCSGGLCCDSACTVQGPCGTDGKCNGNGVGCELYASGTGCGANSSCNGSGTCVCYPNGGVCGDDGCGGINDCIGCSQDLGGPVASWTCIVPDYAANQNVCNGTASTGGDWCNFGVWAGDCSDGGAGYCPGD